MKKAYFIIFTIFLFVIVLNNDIKTQIHSIINSDSIVSDYDGNIYHTVTIGNQVWLKENLKSLHYYDGTAIIGVLSYNNSDSLANIYGRIYTWNATMRNYTQQGVQGVCPVGYHVPTDSEWTVLGNYLGGNSVAGGKLKETDTAHWYSPNTGATNSSGFTAFGGGEWESGVFQYIKMSGVFWSSTQASSTQAIYRYLQYNTNTLSPYTWNKTLAYSVRCIKDNPTPLNLLNGPDDLVFDLKYHRTLVGNWAGNRIIAIDTNGNQSVFKTGITNCHGMELYGDTLYASGTSNIYCVNINSAETIKTISVSGATHLGPITIDTASMIIYVSDWGVNKIFKVNLIDNTSSTLVNSGIVNTPMGLLIDRNNNRLILLGYGTNVPIRAVNISTGNVSTIKPTNLSDLDAITRDKFGNVYITSYALGNVYKIDSGFVNSPALISSGHSGPSGLGYNFSNHKLGVTNYDSNKIIIIDLNSVPVKENNNIISSFELNQNYPNPFNNSTKISFVLQNTALVKLKIFDVSGKEVLSLLNQKLEANKYNFNFDASALSSGVYFYSLEVTEDSKTMNTKIITKSMVLIK
jgi:uncharacterized protein (TIGR02145 family)